MFQTVSTIEAIEELDFEIPGMPLYDTLVEKFEADGDNEQDAITAMREIFEDFNSVVLEDEALEYFDGMVEDYYSEK